MRWENLVFYMKWLFSLGVLATQRKTESQKKKKKTAKRHEMPFQQQQPCSWGVFEITCTKMFLSCWALNLLPAEKMSGVGGWDCYGPCLPPWLRSCSQVPSCNCLLPIFWLAWLTTGGQEAMLQVSDLCTVVKVCLLALTVLNVIGERAAASPFCT